MLLCHSHKLFVFQNISYISSYIPREVREMEENDPIEAPGHHGHRFGIDWDEGGWGRLQGIDVFGYLDTKSRVYWCERKCIPTVIVRRTCMLGRCAVGPRTAI
jgi:hypothetical protein